MSDDDIMDLMGGVTFVKMLDELLGVKLDKFSTRMPYSEAMRDYASDKPDFAYSTETGRRY